MLRVDVIKSKIARLGRVPYQWPLIKSGFDVPMHCLRLGADRSGLNFPWFTTPNYTTCKRTVCTH